MTEGISIHRLVQEKMGQQVHWFSEDVKLNQLAEVMAGMANSNGGKVVIGISTRSHRLLGVRNPEQVIDSIFQAALEISPTLVLPVPDVLNEAGKNYIIAVIPEGLPHVYSLDGRYLHRTGTTTTLIPPKKLRQMLIERGMVNLETKIPEGATVSDLDRDLLDEYRKKLKIDDGSSDYDFLKSRGCLKELDYIFYPTYAGLLLFGMNPQQWLPTASILAVRFPGSTLSDTFVKQEISGNLIQQLKKAEIFIGDHTPRKGSISGMQRIEEEIYPLDVVRELVVNAITHRDYNNQGDHIHVHLYSDRLIVRSPGELPGPVTLDNLLDIRYSRNPVIAQVLSDFGYFERFGYGLNRVIRVLQSKGLQKPAFKEIGGCFEVAVSTVVEGPEKRARTPFYDLDQENPLNDRQMSALDHLRKANRITNSAYQELCPEVSPETLRRDLANLVKRGILLKIGSKRATYYILKKKH